MPRKPFKFTDKCPTFFIGASSSMMDSGTWVPKAPTTIRRHASAEVLGFSCLKSGSSIFIPKTDSFAVGGDRPHPFIDDRRLGQEREIITVV